MRNSFKKERLITMQIKNHDDKSGFTILDGETVIPVNVENFYNAIQLDDIYISVVSDAEGYTRKCFDKSGREIFSIISGQDRMIFLGNEISLDCNFVTADLYCPEQKLVLLANNTDKSGRKHHSIYVFDKESMLLKTVNEPVKTDDRRVEWCSLYYKSGEMLIKGVEYLYSGGECYERNKLHFRLDMEKYTVE